MSTYTAVSVTLYRVWEETDKIEGRRGPKEVGYALTKPEAEEHAKGKGVMGSSTAVTEHRAQKLTRRETPFDICYVLDDDFIEPKAILAVSPQDLEAARAAAKAKLSAHELELLGLA